MTQKPKYTVIVPCYNEEKSVQKTFSELLLLWSKENPFDIIFVNDGSTDNTGVKIKELAKYDARLKVIGHDYNKGYGASLKSGIRKSSTDYIVITDADGTYPNERIPELVSACKEYDMVVGSRTGEGVVYSKIRMIPKIFLRRWVSWITKTDVPDMNSGLRVFKRDVVLNYLNILPDGFSFTTTITIATLSNFHSVLYVPISYSPRVGKSKIRPIRDTLNFIILILRTGTYFAPLRIIAPIAIILLLTSTFSLFYDLFVIKNLTDKTVILINSCLNIAVFALVADMINRKMK